MYLEQVVLNFTYFILNPSGKGQQNSIRMGSQGKEKNNENKT